MKYLKYLAGIASGAMLMTACDVNDLPSFDDADAFVAFKSTSASVAENAGSISIPISLVSRGDMSATVGVTVDTEASTAVEGKDYSIATTSAEISSANRTAQIVINVVDNDEFTGNKKIVLTLKADGAQLGYAKTITVTIEDDEHPLAFIIGSYAAPGVTDYYGDTYDLDLTVSKDESDVTKVWLAGLFPYLYPTSQVYGVVNDEKTEIRVPVGQSPFTYNSVDFLMYGYSADCTELYEDGSFITFQIQEDGAKLLQVDGYRVLGPGVGTSDWFYGGTVFTKQQ